MKRVIALVSDTHVGATNSVFPDSFTSRDGISYSEAMSEEQRRILDYWLDFLDKCDKSGVDTVFAVGDLIAGLNPRERGRYILVPNLDDQRDAAIELLQPLFSKRTGAVWSGTAYHESLDLKVHKYIAERLNAEFFNGLSVLRIKGTNKTAFVAHEFTEAKVYPETYMARDIMFFESAHSKGYLPKIDIIIRAHSHRYSYLSQNGIHYLALPGWQGVTPYDFAIKLYPRFISSLGGVILSIDEEEVTVRPCLYPAPHNLDKASEV